MDSRTASRQLSGWGVAGVTADKADSSSPPDFAEDVVVVQVHPQEVGYLSVPGQGISHSLAMGWPPKALRRADTTFMVMGSSILEDWRA